MFLCLETLFLGYTFRKHLVASNRMLPVNALLYVAVNGFTSGLTL